MSYRKLKKLISHTHTEYSLTTVLSNSYQEIVSYLKLKKRVSLKLMWTLCRAVQYFLQTVFPNGTIEMLRLIWFLLGLCLKAKYHLELFIERGLFFTILIYFRIWTECPHKRLQIVKEKSISFYQKAKEPSILMGRPYDSSLLPLLGPSPWHSSIEINGLLMLKRATPGDLIAKSLHVGWT